MKMVCKAFLKIFFIQIQIVSDESNKLENPKRKETRDIMKIETQIVL